MLPSLKITKRGFALMGIIIVLLILYFFVSVKAGEAYQNCTQILQATGRTHIARGDKLYNPAMDRNHNQIACE